MRSAPLAIALLLLGAALLSETKVIGGVETRAVEDREMKNGQLDGHGGARLSGVNGASTL